MDDIDNLPDDIPEDWLEKRPRRFYLLRREDVTGISGEGIVAWGVMWEDGSATMRWCVDDKPKTTTFYEWLEDVEDLHGHDGKTQIIFIDYQDTPVDNGIPV